MNVRNTALAVLIASLAAAVPAQEHGPEAKVRHLDPRPLARAAKVSLTKAIRVALELQPGTAVQAEIEGEVEGETTQVFYEVMIIDKDGNPFEVVVDPASGECKAKAATESAEEIAAFRTMAAKARLPLETLIKSAAKLVRGKAMVAKLELEDDSVEASITFTVETHDLSVVLDAASGKLEEIEAKAVSQSDEGADDEEDEEGEEAGDAKKGEGGKAKKPGKAKEEREENAGKERVGNAKGKQAK